MINAPNIFIRNLKKKFNSIDWQNKKLIFSYLLYYALIITVSFVAGTFGFEVLPYVFSLYPLNLIVTPLILNITYGLSFISGASWFYNNLKNTTFDISYAIVHYGSFIVLRYLFNKRDAQYIPNKISQNLEQKLSSTNTCIAVIQKKIDLQIKYSKEYLSTIKALANKSDENLDPTVFDKIINWIDNLSNCLTTSFIDSNSLTINGSSRIWLGYSYIIKLISLVLTLVNFFVLFSLCFTGLQSFFIYLGFILSNVVIAACVIFAVLKQSLSVLLIFSVQYIKFCEWFGVMDDETKRLTQELACKKKIFENFLYMESKLDAIEKHMIEPIKEDILVMQNIIKKKDKYIKEILDFKLDPGEESNNFKVKFVLLLYKNVEHVEDHVKAKQDLWTTICQQRCRL